MLKPSKELAAAVVATLRKSFVNRINGDKALADTFRSDVRLSPAARGYVAETVYLITRRWRYYWFLAGLHPADYLIPQAITEQYCWWIWAAARMDAGFGLAPFPELKGVPKEQIAERLASRDGSLAERSSLPDWLYSLGTKELGSAWQRVIDALNQPPQIHLRVNTIKTNPRDLLAQLETERVEATPYRGVPNALRMDQHHNVFTLRAWKEGLFEVQDAGSQRIAPFLQVEPGQRVIDACAGAGGKSLHLAALMRNKGRIIALDVVEWKLEELRRRAARAGVDNLEARLIDGPKSVKRYNATADRVLIDVPCSGIGAFRRNPGARWQLQPDDLPRLRNLQRDILRDDSRMVKPGGKLVYATCSVLPSENEQQVQAFLADEAGQDWKLEEELHLRPDRENCDGFYAARMVKKSA